MLQMQHIKSFICLLSFGVILTSCTPTLLNVKEDSDVVKSLPENYPTILTEQVVSAEDDKEIDGYVPQVKEDDKGIKLDSEGTTSYAVEVTKDSMQKESSKKENITTDSSWKVFFADNHLTNLIDTALKNNQEINILTQEINIANNEIMARRGEYLPKVGIGATAGQEKVGTYTSQGVSDATSEYEPGKTVPEKLPKYELGLNMSWEVDIWKKLRNATKSAMLQYLSTIDGKNFMITRLVAEIANTYYELLALDKQLEIVKNNIAIQTEALELVRLQMQAARVTSLAVRRFQAEVLKNRSRRYEINQKIVQTENKLNFLVGRFPQHIDRDASNFIDLAPNNIKAGVPSQLLSSRPDVSQAERKLAAAKLDVKVAKARFYPSLSIEAGLGYQSFNAKHFFESPESVFYNFAGNLTAPLLNRMGIKADYFSANSKQIQAVYDYERTVINAYTEVVNQLSMINNIENTYKLKSRQVNALNDAVEISNILFKAARADYVEVLMTRRDALEAQMELVEIKKQQLTSFVNLYQAIGGGWKG